MRVLSKKPVPIAAVASYVKDFEEQKPLEEYLKKFSMVKEDNAKKIVEEITALNNPKVNEEITIKIADFLPESAEDLNKIATDVSFSEEEANQITEIVKNNN